jgi:hypothetical protein
VTDSYSFQLVFTMLCNWGELTQYTRLFSLLPEGETPANANDRFCILQSEAGRMHFERRLNGSNKSTSRNLGSEPLKGDTVDIRVRVDSVNGFQFWLGSVKESGEDAALAGSHTVPVDSVELGRYRGHGTRNGNFIIHQFRLVPEALTDEDIEAWT